MLTTQISKMPPSGRVPMSKRHQRDTSEPSGNVLEFPDPAEVLQGLCAQNHQHQLGRPALSSSDQTTRLLEPRLKSQGPLPPPSSPLTEHCTHCGLTSPSACSDHGQLSFSGPPPPAPAPFCGYLLVRGSHSYSPTLEGPEPSSEPQWCSGISGTEASPICFTDDMPAMGPDVVHRPHLLPGLFT